MNPPIIRFTITLFLIILGMELKFFQEEGIILSIIHSTQIMMEYGSGNPTTTLSGITPSSMTPSI